ncbi:MAG: adenylosuccinate lyase [Planctomycetota bacterium]
MNEEAEPRRSLYASPFLTRWAGQRMLTNWSDLRKFRTWRSLWVALAEAQSELGLDISEQQVLELKEHREDIDFETAAAKERELRHDVMAHVQTYAEQCPRAAGIIHLGATSAYVGDNTDLIRMREGLRILLPQVASACRNLVGFASEHRSRPCLAYTHFQPAQPTTVGKRACLWLQDLLAVLASLSELADEMPFRGAKGTTGTQASYLKLFDGDHRKVEELDRRVAEKMGFERLVPVTGQTYPRGIDYRVLSALAELALACSKMAADVRLLAGLKEVEEPFGKKQVGSSAMPYKRNPMRCERMAGLSRFLLNHVQNAGFTAADQWLERTLDDSSNRRLALAEAFLAADSIARLAANVTAGLVVNEPVIERRLRSELPFMATENILMECVRAGGDRQRLHERIRRHSVAAGERVKSGDGVNDLLDRIREDQAFSAVHGRLEELVRPEQFVGRAPEQVQAFLTQEAEPTLEDYPAEERETELKV